VWRKCRRTGDFFFNSTFVLLIVLILALSYLFVFYQITHTHNVIESNRINPLSNLGLFISVVVALWAGQLSFFFSVRRPRLQGIRVHFFATAFALCSPSNPFFVSLYFFFLFSISVNFYFYFLQGFANKIGSQICRIAIYQKYYKIYSKSLGRCAKQKRY